MIDLAQGKKLLLLGIIIFTCACLFNGASASTIDDVLLSAVNTNNLDLAKNAISQGANVNYLQPNGHTPLSLAVKKKNAVMTGILLASGADPNQRMETISYTDTPLIIAAVNDDLKIAQMLIQNGADVNMRREKRDNGVAQVTYSKDGSTPLIFAIEKDSIENPSLSMVQLLIAQGADVNLQNEQGYTPLMASVAHKWGKESKIVRCQIAKALLQGGADPAAKDKRNKTALQYATDKNFTEMINLLLPVSPK